MERFSGLFDGYIEHMGNRSSSPSNSDSIGAAARAISGCDHVFVFCGAGMSVDSGLPTYNDIARVPAYTGREYIDICTPSLMYSNPCEFYGFWGHCYNSYSAAEPHEGYSSLRKIQGIKDTFTVTSNVDGLLPRSGVELDRLYELHGSMNRWQCSKPRLCSAGETVWDYNEGRFSVDEESRTVESGFPQCRHCDKMARPTVYMFGDENCIHNEAQMVKFNLWKRDVLQNDGRIVIIEIGVGLKVTRLRDESKKILGQISEGRCSFLRINPFKDELQFDLIDSMSGSDLISRDHYHPVQLGARDGLVALLAAVDVEMKSSSAASTSKE